MKLDKNKTLIGIAIVISAVLTYAALYYPNFKLKPSQDRYTNEEFNFSFNLGANEKILVCDDTPADTEGGAKGLTVTVIEKKSELTACDASVKQFLSVAYSPNEDVKESVKNAFNRPEDIREEYEISGIKGDRYKVKEGEDTADFTVIKNDKISTYYFITSDYYNRDFKTFND